MRMSRSALMMLLAKSVVELKFSRRISKPGFSADRRMLCTNDRFLLNSGPGKEILNYQPPSGQGLKYDPAAKNLIPVWDIFMQSYRTINCDDVDVISVIQTTPEPDKWWTYFSESIMPMAINEKASFMNN
jgi:hypothetical protein